MLVKFTLSKSDKEVVVYLPSVFAFYKSPDLSMPGTFIVSDKGQPLPVRESLEEVEQKVNLAIKNKEEKSNG